MYAETKEYSNEKLALFEEEARKTIDAINEELSDPEAGNVRGFRSAGAHAHSAALLMADFQKLYWKTGVTAGNSRDAAALGIDGKDRLNPTLILSSTPKGEFAMHNELDPLLGFHLAEVFDNDMDDDQRQERLATVAKAQFRAWCHSFAGYVHKGTISINLHCGEAVNLCYELQSIQFEKHGLPKFTHLYTRPWSAKSLSIVESNSTSQLEPFDVIDISNLIDYVGLLNILPAVVPLLSHTPSSILLTECSILAAEEPRNILDALLFTDATTSSLILGVAPVSYLTGFTTDSVGFEAFCTKTRPVQVNRQRYLRMRIPWKWPVSGDPCALTASSGNLDSLLGPIIIDSEALAQWLFDLYLNIFDYEVFPCDESKTFSFGTLGRPLAGDLRYYSRTNFVILIRFVKARVQTDWEACISALSRMVKDDFSLLSTQDTYQEFRTRLHLYGVWRSDILEADPRFQQFPHGPIRGTKGETGILHHSPCPPLVFVALVIPRRCLKPLTDVSPDTATTPRLYLSIGSKEFSEHHFFGIDCFFGKLIRVPGRTGHCGLEEDAKGWHGTSDLVVSCLVPTWMLLLGPRSNITVSVNVYPSPTSVSRYGDKLDEDMTVFRCGLDEGRLWVLEAAPGVSSSGPSPFKYIESPSLPQDSAAPSIALNHDGRVKNITIKLDFLIHTIESKTLKEGAKITVSQISPCVLQLKIGKLSRKLTYPYPIDGNNSVTKVSRERSFIQVAAPTSSAKMPGGFGYNPFPVLLQERLPVLWNIPRLVIDQQPCVTAPLNFDCLFHTSVAMSEDDANHKTLQGRKAAFANVKLNIVAFFSSIVGKHPNAMGISTKAFGLSKSKMIDTLIFTHAMRHDRDAGSVFLEAYTVPLSDSRQKPILRCLRDADIKWIPIGDAELTLWKQLLPARVERCRVTWDHKSSCQYLAKGRIPLSTTQGEIPICGCGEGLDVANFPASLSGLAMYATRIAIPLLSAVPYVEPMPPFAFVGALSSNQNP